MKFSLSALVAVLCGLVVLAGFFIPLSAVQQASNLLINWAVLLAASAVIVGIVSLLRSHWQKMQLKRNPDRFSIMVFLVFIATLAAGFITGGPSQPAFQYLITNLQFPIEATLMGLLTFTLILACLRLFKGRGDLITIVFASSAVLFLILYSGVLSANPDLPYIKEFLGVVHRLPISGTRGILIGLALGNLLTGLRVLFGIDRPYSG
ncbi:MAG: hypothetical protein AB9891_09695 [Anaerolineaceae bacterium]